MSGERDGVARTWYPRCRAYLDVILDGYGEGDGLGSADQPLHVEVYPKSAKIHGNSYHQPDSWEMTFDARNCPFDPALIRLATVQIMLYDAGQMEDPTGAVDDGGDSIEPDIIGLFDDDSMEMDASGRWITVQGQDLTTLFSGKQWPPLPNGRARRIPTGVPLHRFVQDRINDIPGTHKMEVAFDEAMLSELAENPATYLDITNGVVRPGTRAWDLIARSMPIVGKDQPAGHGRGIPVQQGTTYWDVIYKTVIRMGYICYVRGWDIVIARPKNLVDFKNANIVKMAWGNNIEHITLQRKLGKQKVPTVIVVAYNENGKFIDRYIWPQTSLTKGKTTTLLPKKPATTTHVTEKHTIKGTTAAKPIHHKANAKPKATVVKENEEFMIVPVHGTFNPTALLERARTLYTLMGRGERRIIVKTHDLTDIDGKPLLHLMAGDAAQIFWQDFGTEGRAEGAQTMQAMTTEKRVQYLLTYGYQPDVARVLAVAYDNFAAKQNPPLRIREITKDFDNEQGLSLEIELVDFAVKEGVRS